MDSLQSAFEQVLRELPYRTASELISAKLAAVGVKLRPRELDKLVEHLQAGTDEDFQLRTWRWWENRKLIVSLTDEDVKEIGDRLNRFLAGGLDNLITSITDDLAQVILKALHRAWQKEARRQAKERDGFEKRLLRRWGAAIDRLRMTLTIARELGESVNESLRYSHTSSPCLVNVLTRLHARSCQIVDEIICLLDSGFSDGAMARWRTLHEIAAVTLLLNELGESLAVRYVEHEAVESYRAATDYRACCDRLGYEPMKDEEYDQVRLKRDILIERYGQDFGTQYGWAAEALKKSRPSIRDIQEAARVDHLRAHYRMASHNIHANPKGVFFKLGMLEETDVLLAGPSNMGLADPGHSCAISLMHVTTALCVLEPNLDSLIGLRILDRLVDEVGNLFIEAHMKLISDVG